jgi:hypothetical protein
VDDTLEIGIMCKLSSAVTALCFHDFVGEASHGIDFFQDRVRGVLCFRTTREVDEYQLDNVIDAQLL